MIALLLESASILAFLFGYLNIGVDNTERVVILAQAVLAGGVMSRGNEYYSPSPCCPWFSFNVLGILEPVLTLRAIRGHPKALVLLKVTSMGKFQTTAVSCPPARCAICDKPVSSPCKTEANIIERGRTKNVYKLKKNDLKRNHATF